MPQLTKEELDNIEVIAALEPREVKQVNMAVWYHSDAFGTSNHILLQVIAKLALGLLETEKARQQLQDEINQSHYRRFARAEDDPL